MYGLAQRRIARGGRGAIVFGYGTLADAEINKGVNVLAEVVEGMSERDAGRGGWRRS